MVFSGRIRNRQPENRHGRGTLSGVTEIVESRETVGQSPVSAGGSSVTTTAGAGDYVKKRNKSRRPQPQRKPQKSQPTSGRLEGVPRAVRLTLVNFLWVALALVGVLGAFALGYLMPS
jgi:hypothetical protein